MLSNHWKIKFFVFRRQSALFGNILKVINVWIQDQISYYKDDLSAVLIQLNAPCIQVVKLLYHPISNEPCILRILKTAVVWQGAKT